MSWPKWLKRKAKAPQQRPQKGFVITFHPGDEKPYRIGRRNVFPDGNVYIRPLGAEATLSRAEWAVERLRQFPMFFPDKTPE